MSEGEIVATWLGASSEKKHPSYYRDMWKSIEDCVPEVYDGRSERVIVFVASWERQAFGTWDGYYFRDDYGYTFDGRITHWRWTHDDPK